MSKLATPFDVRGLEEALGVKHIRRAEVTFDVDCLVTAKVQYYLEKEQAQKVADVLVDLKKGERQKQKCEQCGTDIGVTLDPDPFAEEVRCNSTPVWMCHTCRTQSARDI